MRPVTPSIARLKAKVRGWHHDPHPGFHDVKGKFDHAARRNGEKKVASYTFKSAYKTREECDEVTNHYKQRWAPARVNVRSMDGRWNIKTDENHAGSAFDRMLTPEQIKLSAVSHVLGKFALLDDHGDPIVELTRIIKADDFGYTDRKAGPKNQTKMRDEKPVWGPNAGMAAGGLGDRLGARSNETYGGV